MIHSSSISIWWTQPTIRGHHDITVIWYKPHGKVTVWAHSDLKLKHYIDLTVTSQWWPHPGLTQWYHNVLTLYSVICHHDHRSDSSGVLCKLMWMLIICFSFDVHPGIKNKYFNLLIDLCLQCCGCHFLSSLHLYALILVEILAAFWNRFVIYE